MNAGKVRSIKSASALAYLKDFLKQCPSLDPMFDCDVTIEIDIYYSSRRPDLDESIILDALQGRVYLNDRQVRRKIITGYVDKDNPRADITIYPYQSNDTRPEPTGPQRQFPFVACGLSPSGT